MDFSEYFKFNNSPIPPEESIIVISSTVYVSPAFVIYHFIKTSIENNQKVIFVGFQDKFEDFVFISKKWGFDLVSKVLSGNLIYIDGLTKLYGYTLDKWSLKEGNIDKKYIKLSGESNLKDICEIIMTSIEEGCIRDIKPCLILWGMDFLVASEILSPSDLLMFISSIQEMVHYCVITINSDFALLSPKKRESCLEINYSTFSYGIVHRAYSIISLRHFPDGKTKEVTGVIRICRGSGYYGAEKDNFSDKSENDESKNTQLEMLYSVNDSGVRFFHKGTIF
ncbi:hypothetical protein T552_04186 [Pneumocystis carinii B80]|uniref:Elongator complex protein 6 n=1 Tax=Pneumocystis carinii (strain B80) TaxID=1408658 RepID=A0A0W4ZDH3_PNEC8|nr:hypothetical protein T552_04186 [Pneumocystis carinii B80]KTW26359.1 hypothetical protein T552_04186 [Pneumocystis carinii B80]